MVSQVVPMPAPDAAWSAIKDELRRRLGKSAERWLEPARLLRVLGGDTLLIALPPKGKIIFAALHHKKLLQHLSRQLGLGAVLTIYPDDWQVHQLKERFRIELDLPDGFGPDEEPQIGGPPINGATCTI